VHPSPLLFLQVARTSQDQNVLHQKLEWVLPQFDPATTNEESVEEELKRLQAVQSYLLLDSQREEAFDRITALAARIFDAPMAVVSLIDLGRQWLISYEGIDCQELHRKDAVCARKFAGSTFWDETSPTCGRFSFLPFYKLSHTRFVHCALFCCVIETIMAKEKVLVIPDLSKDFRTRDIITVSQPPHLRFYAAASLISPEGYRLGTLCVIDPVPRPNGLTADETQTLIDLAELTVKVMVDRRYQLEQAALREQERPDPVQLLTKTAQDLMAPLTGIQLSLSMLREDELVQSVLDDRQTKLLDTAAAGSDLAIRIWQDTLDGALMMEENGLWMPELPSTEVKTAPTTRLENLVQHLKTTMDPISKRVPCVITLDPSAPTEIVGDELKLFRCALNLLMYAVHRTDTGMVHLVIRTDTVAQLILFECEDTAADIAVDKYEHLFQASHVENQHCVALLSIAALVTAIDGEYGFRPRGVDATGNVLTDAFGCRRSGSIFWFSVPWVPLLTTEPTSSNQVDDALATPGPLPSLVPSHASTVEIPFDLTKSSPYDPGVELGMLMEMGLGFEPESSCARAVSCDEAIANFSALNAIGSEEDAKLVSILEDLESYAVDGLSATDGNSHRRRRILIIDDSIVVRRNLARVVDDKGYDAVLATNGVEGLKEMQQSLYDLVFCDFAMPIMDGPLYVDPDKSFVSSRSWSTNNHLCFA
jgi:CheY-like chemotaxis protein